MEAYLERDVRNLTQVGDILAYKKFMTCVAARTSRAINYDEIANEVGVSAPTIKKWLSILVASNIVVEVRPYYNNLLKRAIKSPIIHFMDTGLCAYLLNWTSPETLMNGAFAGQIFESYVFSEIYKSYTNVGVEPPLFYYRDNNQKEIDLIIYQNNVLYPIEIKMSSNVDKKAVKNFNVLYKMGKDDKESFNLNVGTGLVISNVKDVLPIDKNNWVIPHYII